MKERRLRLAVIGLGKMGLLHASLLNIISEVELVALVDKSALMARLCKRIFSSTDVRVMRNLEELSRFDLDAAYITTPISSHSFIATDLLRKRIAHNIFVEKTLASNYDQAKEMCELAKRFGGTTMVGYMKRFSVTFRKAKELLSQQIVGEPHFFKAYAYSSDFQGLTKESQSSSARGGALRDIGCHTVDLGLWLLGDLEVRNATVTSDATEMNSITSISFGVQNSEGVEGQFDVSQRMTNYRMPEFGLIIDCSKGRIEVNDDRLSLTLESGAFKKWYKQDLSDNVAFFLGEAEYFRENQHFVDSIRSNQPSELSFEEASKVDKLINEVKKKGNFE